MATSRDLPLATKGLLVVMLPVTALLLAMVVFYQFARATAEAEHTVERTFQMRSDMRRLHMSMLNAETGIRGYLLTGRAKFLEPYEEALRELPQIRANLRRSVQELPTEAAHLDRVESLEAELLSAMDRSRLLVAQRNPQAALVELDRDKAYMDALRTELDEMTTRAQQLLDQRSAAARAAERRTGIAIFAGGALGLLGGLIAVLLFTTRIASRVRHLEEDAREVAAGRPIAHPVVGDDEIARLERALQETSELLRRRADELAEAHKQLETRVEQRTADLQASNDVRDALIRSSPLGIWAVDLDGNVTFWNPAAERMFGWTEAEVLGRRLPIVANEDQEDYRDWLRRFAAGESIVGVERRRLRKSGETVDVMIWTAPLRDAGSRIRGTIAIDSDVSQQKLLEEQFRQSQKLEAVGRLAGGVAHDFNNLLTVIHGYADMISGETEDQPRIVEYTREIEYAAGRASSLTAQLLAFSRRQVSQPKVLDLNEVVTHSVKLLRRVIGEDVEIVTSLDPRLGCVKADPIHIDQVLMNLVVNARDAMSGGGRITIETRNQHLDADYAGRHLGVEPGDYCMLAVSDTGSGMTPETRDRLFEPFFTTKEKGKGTGLGLSIVYGIVKQNHGEILVYTEPGHGTTFKIYLPMVSAAREVESSVTRVPTAGRGETILVCEDEPSIRDLVERMLEREGYRALVAESPEDALRIAADRALHIDALLTDLIMPKMSGFDLARQVVALRPEIKTLYMSGYADSHLAGMQLDESVPFLQKPFTASALARSLRATLENGHTATSPDGLP
jgi:PAS domain S-box-containing protein